jgi:hypothetical protein
LALLGIIATATSLLLDDAFGQPGPAASSSAPEGPVHNSISNFILDASTTQTTEVGRSSNATHPAAVAVVGDPGGAGPAAWSSAFNASPILSLEKFAAPDTHLSSPDTHLVAPHFNTAVSAGPAVPGFSVPPSTGIVVKVASSSGVSIADQEVGLALGVLPQNLHINHVLSSDQAQVLSEASAVPVHTAAKDVSPTTDGASAHALAAPQTTTTGPSTSVSSASPGDAGSSASVAPASTSGGSPAAGASANSVVAVTGANMNVAEADIQHFMAQHPNFEMLQQGTELILYDPQLTPANEASSFHETLTFSDGSSVFLIGLPATHHAPPLG